MKNMEPSFVKEMFEEIAHRYDLLNRLLSLRQDVYWRRTMVAAMEIPDDGVVLDVACGTGDVALEVLRQRQPKVTVFGIDFSQRMLIIARDKIDREKIKGVCGNSDIHLLAGNAFDLPFRTETFDAIAIAFGIRNINDKLSLLNIFHDSLKRGGMLLVLELATPQKSLLSFLYLFYFKRVLPLIGWLFSLNLKAYRYLPSSVAVFPEPDIFASMMRLAGFKDVKWKRLTMGIATLHVGCK